jgi:hypothetical protein
MELPFPLWGAAARCKCSRALDWRLRSAMRLSYVSTQGLPGTRRWNERTNEGRRSGQTSTSYLSIDDLEWAELALDKVERRKLLLLQRIAL